jgi:phage shock protein E
LADNPTKSRMNNLEFLKQYWPFLLLVLWFSYKWWNSKRIVAMLPELKNQGAQLIDVRTMGEYSAQSAPGTINIPLSDLNKRLSEVSMTSPVVLCCASGSRSGMAKFLLKRHGYKQVYNIGAWNKLLD